MKVIFAIMFGFSVLYAQTIRDDNSKTVIDYSTTLEWQDDILGHKLKWMDAIDYCENLTLRNFDNWRLPNINELRSIIDISKYKPALVSGFQNPNDNLSYEYGAQYWSSTSYGSYAWRIEFKNGFLQSNEKTREYYVKCVRDAK